MYKRKCWPCIYLNCNGWFTNQWLYLCHLKARHEEEPC